MTGQPILEIDSLSKTFPGQVALDRASLTVRAGEVHALVGQNGSGKSTLIKVLAGYHPPDPGAQVRLMGRDVDVGSLSDADRGRIRVMHQDLGLVASLDSVENLALGRGFDTTRLGRVRWKAETARAWTLLRSFGATFDPRLPVAALTQAERAVLALARAMQDWDGQGGVLVLDEPTASLPRPEVDRLFAAVRQVRDRGAGVVFVSHRLDEVFEIADVVTVLRDGEVVANRPTEGLDHDTLIELIVGRPIEELYVSPPETGQDVVLTIEHLWGDVVEDADLVVRKGEIVGLAGLVGSGRDELPALAFGAIPRARGTVRLGDREVPSDPHRAIGMGLAYVPSDRKRLGSIPVESVAQNITLPHLAPLFHRGNLSRRREERDVAGWIERVELRPPDPHRPLQNLSGGNQQKAVLARWLRTEPKVLLLDEPTQGVDVGAKATIYALVADAAARGTAVLVASSEAEELAAICDRVLVMRNGRVAAELQGAALTPDAIVQQILK